MGIREERVSSFLHAAARRNERKTTRQLTRCNKPQAEKAGKENSEMSREHIKRMGEAVRGYYAQALKIEAQRQRNNESYREDIAEQENAKLRDALQTARLNAESAIREAQEDGRSDAGRWGKLSGAEMTEDAKLLQMDISPEQFSDLVDRYKGNGTMTTLLSQYGERKNREATEAGEYGMGPFDLSGIATAEKKAEVYDKFAMGAQDLIARVNQDNTLGGGVNSPMLKTAVEQFGEPSAFNASLFEML